VFCLLVLSTGCVSKQAHESLTTERDRLGETNLELVRKVVSMERAIESLEAERILLIDEVETLSEEQSQLEATRGSLETQVTTQHAALEEMTVALVATTAERDAAKQEVLALQETYQGLVDDLEIEVSRGSIEIEQLRSGLRLAVSDEILFESGSADLEEEGSELLVTISEHLQQIDYAIEVVGHSDDRQIRSTLAHRYPSNWELAGARAAAVVRLFLSSGIEGQRLQASSRAEFEPLASNDSAEGRSRNRRIEIRLRPLAGSNVEGAAEHDALGAAGADEAREVADSGAS